MLERSASVWDDPHCGLLPRLRHPHRRPQQGPRAVLRAGPHVRPPHPHETQGRTVHRKACVVTAAGFGPGPRNHAEGLRAPRAPAAHTHSDVYPVHLHTTFHPWVPGVCQKPLHKFPARCVNTVTSILYAEQPNRGGGRLRGLPVVTSQDKSPRRPPSALPSFLPGPPAELSLGPGFKPCMQTIVSLVMEVAFYFLP